MNKKIRVLHFISGFKFGGIQRLVYDLVSAQKENTQINSEILVVNNAGEFADRFGDLHIPIHAINPKSTYRFGCRKLKTIANLLDHIDIVQFHSFHKKKGITIVIPFYALYY